VTATPESSPLQLAHTRRSLFKLLLTMAALAAMSALFLFVPIDYERVGGWGYVGVFIVVFIATASFILPIPYLLIVARAGLFLDPLLIGLVAGVAAAIGELTGYLIGISGRDLIARGKWFDKADHWMRTYGFWCVAFFSFIPNPFFDAIGLAAGALRYPPWRFTLACLLGKTAKFVLVALAGARALT
jgi:membrane protein YqaA with SNARE-associated domain